MDRKGLFYIVFILLFLTIGSYLLYESINEIIFSTKKEWFEKLFEILFYITLAPGIVLLVPFIITERILFGKLENGVYGEFSWFIFPLLVFAIVFTILVNTIDEYEQIIIKNFAIIKLLMVLLITFLITKWIYKYVFKNNEE